MPNVIKTPTVKADTETLLVALGKKKPTTDVAKTILEMSRKYFETDSN